MSAANAHFVLHGAEVDNYDKVADSLNANDDYTIQVDGKIVRDKCKQVQKFFTRNSQAEAPFFGVGGEVTKKDKLLTVMRDMKKEQAIQKKKHWQEIRYLELSKLLFAAHMLESVTTDVTFLTTDKQSRSGDDLNVYGGVERNYMDGFKSRKANNGWEVNLEK